MATALPTVNQVLPARGLCFTSSGGKVGQSARLFADDIQAAVQDHCGREKRLAVDRFPFAAIDALRDRGFDLRDADSVMSRARRIKLPQEIVCMKEAMARHPGGAQAIMKLERGWAAGSDPRKDGMAAGH